MAKKSIICLLSTTYFLTNRTCIFAHTQHSFFYTHHEFPWPAKKGEQSREASTMSTFKIANCCWFLHAILSIILEELQKEFDQDKKKLSIWGKSSKRRTKSTHNGISYMQEEGRHLDQDEILVTCCYWHVPGQKILGLTQAKKKGKENRKTWTTWGFFFKEVLKDQWRFLSPWVTYLLWILLQWISASLVGWTSTGLNVK